MSIERLHTPQSPSHAGQGKAAGPAVVPAGSGALPAVSFLDFILARLSETPAAEKTPGPALLRIESKPLERNPNFQDEGPDIAVLIADNPELAEEIEKHGMGGPAGLAEALELNQQAFDAILRPLEGELPPEEKEEQARIETSRAENRYTIPGLAALLGLEEGSEPSPMISNLTPAQIAALTEKVERAMEKAPPPGKAGPAEIAVPDVGAIETIPAEAEEPLPVVPVSAGTEPKQIVQKHGAPQSVLTTPQAPAAGGFEVAKPPVIGKAPAPPATDFENSASPAVEKDIPEKAVQNVKADMPKADMPLRDLPVRAMENFAGALSFSADGFEVTGLPGTGASGQSVTGLGQVTNAVLQAQSAAQPHPATQMVAASIVKAAGPGESKNFTIRMEPPELGRIQVQMEFGKEKSLKTVLTVEKPETYMMLQRDVHVLERALQAMGLDTSDGVSFELAQGDHGFGQDGGHENGRGQAGGDGEAVPEILETKMTWFVDEQTGHTRYDIFA